MNHKKKKFDGIDFQRLKGSFQYCYVGIISMKFLTFKKPQNF